MNGKEGSPLDVTQIPLKINQTILSDGAKLNAEIEPKLNSFLNILYGQYLKSNSETTSEISTEASSEIEVDIQPYQLPTEEKWQELEAIIEEVLSIFKEIKSLIGTSAEQMNDLATSDETQLYANPSFKKLYQDVVDQLENQNRTGIRQPLGGSQELNRLLAETKDPESISLNSGEKGKLPLFNDILTSQMPSYLNVRDNRQDNLGNVGINPRLQQLTENSLPANVTPNMGANSDKVDIGKPLSEEVDSPPPIEIRTSEPLPSVLNRQPNRVDEFGFPLGMRQQAEEGTKGLTVKNDLNVVATEEPAGIKAIPMDPEDIPTFKNVQPFEKLVDKVEGKEGASVFQQRGESEKPVLDGRISPEAVESASHAKIPLTHQAEISESRSFLTSESSRIENGVRRGVNLGFQPLADEWVPPSFASPQKEQTSLQSTLIGKTNIPMSNEVQPTDNGSFVNVEAERSIANPSLKVDAPILTRVSVSMNGQQDSVQQPEVNLGTQPLLTEHLEVEAGNLVTNRVETKAPVQANRGVHFSENINIPEGNRGRISPNASLLNGHEQSIGLQNNSEVISSIRHPKQPFAQRFEIAGRTSMINRGTTIDQKPVNYSVNQMENVNGHKVFISENPSLLNVPEGVKGQPEMKAVNSSFQSFKEAGLELSGKPEGNGMELNPPEPEFSRFDSIGKRNIPSANQVNEQPNSLQTLENALNLNLEPDQVEKPQRYINLGFGQSKEASQGIIGRPDVNEETGKAQVQIQASTNLKTSEKQVLSTIEEVNSLESVMGLSQDDNIVESQETFKTTKSMQQTNEESQVDLADYLRPVRTAMNELQNLTSLAERGGTIPSDKSTFVQNAVFNLQDNLVDVLNHLGDWLQELKGPSPASKMDFNQMMEDLVQFLAKQPAENQKNLQMPDKLKNNIQQLLDQLDFPIEGENSVKHTVSFERIQIGVGANPRLGSLFEDAKRSHIPVTEAKVSLSTRNEPMNIAPLELKQTDVVNNSKPAMSAPSVPVPEFAARMSEWIGRNLVMQNGKAGNAETRFLLNPEHLGPVEIKISFDQDGKLTAQILTDTGSAKEILETQLQQLKQNLQQQGLVVQKLDVTQQVQMQIQDSNQAGMMFYEGGSSSSHEHQNPQSNEKLSKSPSEAEQMELENDQGAFTYGGASRKSSSQIDFTA